MFDEENFFSLAIFLSFCQSVHNIYTFNHDYKTMYFSQNFCVFFRKIFALFFAKFSHYSFAKFLHYFFAKCSHYFFAKFSHFLFRENFRIFRERTKCENEAKWSRNDFSFLLETLGQTDEF